MNPMDSGVLTTFDLSDHYGTFWKVLTKNHFKTKNMSNFKTKEFYCSDNVIHLPALLNLVISLKIIAIQLTNFLIISYQYLPKW